MQKIWLKMAAAVVVAACALAVAACGSSGSSNTSNASTGSSGSSGSSSGTTLSLAGLANTKPDPSAQHFGGTLNVISAEGWEHLDRRS